MAPWPQNCAHDGARAIAFAQCRRPTPSRLDILAQMIARVVPLLGCRETCKHPPHGRTTIAPVALHPSSMATLEPSLTYTHPYAAWVGIENYGLSRKTCLEQLRTTFIVDHRFAVNFLSFLSHYYFPFHFPPGICGMKPCCLSSSFQLCGFRRLP